MRYILELPPESAEKIRSLLGARKYKDLQSFVLTAIDNQLYIESQDLSIQSGSARPTVETEHRHDLPRMKEISRSWSSVVPAPMPDKTRIWSEYVWGQYNRIFPAKITLRVLANYLDGQAESIDLNDLREAAANIAREIGLFLHSREKTRGLKRGDTWSVALPIEADSRFRFMNQFVGYVTKAGLIYGMPGVLGWTNFLRADRISITEPGLRFASLENPILDAAQFQRTLSDDEREFYLSHVRSWLPKEYQMMKQASAYIRSGENTFASIKDRVRALNREWSDAVLSTMVAGVLARMKELQLVSTRREGLRSFYELLREP